MGIYYHISIYIYFECQCQRPVEQVKLARLYGVIIIVVVVAHTYIKQKHLPQLSLSQPCMTV